MQKIKMDRNNFTRILKWVFLLSFIIILSYSLYLSFNGIELSLLFTVVGIISILMFVTTNKLDIRSKIKRKLMMRFGKTLRLTLTSTFLILAGTIICYFSIIDLHKEGLIEIELMSGIMITIIGFEKLFNYTIIINERNLIYKEKEFIKLTDIKSINVSDCCIKIESTTFNFELELDKFNSAEKVQLMESFEAIKRDTSSNKDS